MAMTSTASIRAATNATPSWAEVEDVLADLARAKTAFETDTSVTNRITSYDPGRRLMLESDSGSSWVEVECIKACWETFERLGRITRADVLEPGRRSAFMVALFERVAGVRRETGDETYLVLAPRTP